MKTKIKSYDDWATGFHDEEMPNAGCNYTCLTIMTIDSALKKEKKLLSASVFKIIQICEKRGD